jgi:hypothetical protein
MVEVHLLETFDSDTWLRVNLIEVEYRLRLPPLSSCFKGWTIPSVPYISGLAIRVVGGMSHVRTMALDLELWGVPQRAGKFQDILADCKDSGPRSANESERRENVAGRGTFIGTMTALSLVLEGFASIRLGSSKIVMVRASRFNFQILV